MPFPIRSALLLRIALLIWIDGHPGGIPLDAVDDLRRDLHRPVGRRQQGAAAVGAAVIEDRVGPWNIMEGMEPIDEPARETSLESSLQRLSSEDREVRWAAVYALGSLGEHACDAVPDLLSSIDSEDMGCTVASALKQIDPENAEPALIRLLSDPSALAGARAGAAGGLRQIETVSAQALEALTQALGDPDARVADAVRRTLVDLAERAPATVPRIINTLENAFPAARRDSIRILGKLRWRRERPEEAQAIVPAILRALKDPNPAVRREAAEALWFAQEPSETADPALAELVGDPDPSVRTQALKTLQYVQGQSVDLVHALAAGLQDADVGVRVEAALGFAYHSCAPSGEEELKAIFAEALGAGDAETRVRALEGLWHTGGCEGSVIETFVRHLMDPNPHVRGSAALQLSYVGLFEPKRAKPAVPALVEALADADPRVRWCAARALAKIEPGEAALHAFLEGLLAQETFRFKAAALLLKIGAAVEAALGVLVAALKKRWAYSPWRRGAYIETERNLAARALMRHASPRSDVARALEPFLDEPDPMLRVEIALALARLEPGNEAALGVIAAGLKHEDKNARRATAQGLGHVVKSNECLVPILVEALRDSHKEVRLGALLALKRLEKTPVEAVPALVYLLGAGGDEPRGARFMALKALGSLGPEARAAVPGILEVLQGSDVSLKACALVALVRIGPTDASCLPALLDALQSYNAALRASALEGLGKLGSAAAPAEHFITKALDDGDPSVRKRAALVLASLGRRTEAVVAVLEEAAKDSDERIRERARDALG